MRNTKIIIAASLAVAGCGMAAQAQEIEPVTPTTYRSILELVVVDSGDVPFNGDPLFAPREPDLLFPLATPLPRVTASVTYSYLGPFLFFPELTEITATPLQEPAEEFLPFGATRLFERERSDGEGLVNVRIDIEIGDTIFSFGMDDHTGEDPLALDVVSALIQDDFITRELVPIDAPSLLAFNYEYRGNRLEAFGINGFSITLLNAPQSCIERLCDPVCRDSPFCGPDPEFERLTRATFASEADFTENFEAVPTPGRSASGVMVVDTAPVPLPASLALLLAGLGTLGLVKRRKRV